MSHNLHTLSSCLAKRGRISFHSATLYRNCFVHTLYPASWQHHTPGTRSLRCVERAALVCRLAKGGFVHAFTAQEGASLVPRFLSWYPESEFGVHAHINKCSYSSTQAISVCQSLYILHRYRSLFTDNAVNIINYQYFSHHQLSPTLRPDPHAREGLACETS